MGKKFRFAVLVGTLVLSAGLHAAAPDKSCEESLIADTADRDAKIGFILSHLPENSKISFRHRTLNRRRTGVVGPALSADGSAKQFTVSFKDRLGSSYIGVGNMEQIRLVDVPGYPGVKEDPISITGDLSVVLPFLPAGTRVQLFYPRQGGIVTGTIEPAVSSSGDSFKSYTVLLKDEDGTPLAAVGAGLVSDVRILSIPQE